jgi:hypothetical protein
MPTAATKTQPSTTGLAAWRKLGVHTVHLPSGAVVKIRIPDLSVLVAGEAVPEDLRAVALASVRQAMKQALTKGDDAEAEDEAEEISDEALLEQMQGLAGLNRFLVSYSLVEPQVDADELVPGQSPIPSEDIIMLTEFATRRRNVDARGVRLGIEPIDRWELWRQTHACPDECDHCAEVIAALSSIA